MRDVWILFFSIFTVNILAFLDFHTNRDYVVNTLLQFHPVMIEYVAAKYSSLLNAELETVSFHFRLGGETEV
jgi:hypothetical protein